MLQPESEKETARVEARRIGSMRNRPSFTAAAIVALAASVPAFAQGTASTFEKDRASILAMAGDFDVEFDMQETVPFVADYTPLEPKISGGHEVVRVVEDTGRTIRLQHLLVASRGQGAPMVIKHWRQDWVYEPESVLVYEASDAWTLQAVPEAERRGRWAQTVWQTDDSPRYGGIGRWRYDGGVARWMSSETRRPLARRDAIRNPPYDHYIGTNRHALTPDGWVHEQDNAKNGTRDGRTMTFVHEVVINTYTRDAGFAVAAADEYWTKTAPYWAVVRAEWEAAITRRGGVRVAEEAENGSEAASRLMGLATDVAAGRVQLDQAIGEARRVIAAVDRGEAVPAAASVAAR